MLLEKLFENLALTVDPFATCRLADGWRLRLPCRDWVTLHYILQGDGELKLGSTVEELRDVFRECVDAGNRFFVFNMLKVPWMPELPEFDHAPIGVAIPRTVRRERKNNRSRLGDGHSLTGCPIHIHRQSRAIAHGHILRATKRSRRSR